MRELSLFSGAGGGLLGTKLLKWEAVGYVEYNEYCQRVIAQRIKDGILDHAPIYGDIRTFISEGYADSYTGMVDVVTAGFPCQPFSTAGKGLGEADPRNMWPATIEVIRRVRPRWCLLENVPRLATREYFGTVLSDLEAASYHFERPIILAAADVGAPHLRERLWIAAHSDSDCIGCGNDECPAKKVSQGWFNALGWAEGLDKISDRRPERLEKNADDGQVCKSGYSVTSDSGLSGMSVWNAAAPDRTSFCGMADGVADRVDRLKAIGNGQVPAVVRRVWELIGE